MAEEALPAAATTADTLPEFGAGSSAVARIERTDDFTDRLSPMLVKELRQGLRAKTFIAVFLALQGFLALVMLIALAGSAESSNGEPVSKVIFFFFAVASLVVQPLRGVGALSGEMKGNTIELMVMTRLTSWRIVLGKWVSLTSQTALLFLAVAPYLILRYFLGGMSLFAELLAFTTVFFYSGVFTAFTVGLSALPSVIIRGLLPLVAAVMVCSGIIHATSSEEFGRIIHTLTLQQHGDWPQYGLFLGCGGYLGWILLSLAVSAIAPAAENHSTAPRLATLAALMLTGLATLLAPVSREELVSILLLVTVPAVFMAAGERFNLLPPNVQPFLRWGTPGRLAGRLLYPGWPSGTVFSVLSLGAAAALLEFAPGAPEVETRLVLYTFAATLFAGLIISYLFQNRVKSRFSLYLLCIVILVAVCVIVTAVVSSMSPPAWNVEWALCWVPPMPLILSMDNQATPEYLAKLAAGLAGGYGLLSLALAARPLMKVSEIERDTLRYQFEPEETATAP